MQDQVVNVENQLNELTLREAEISRLFKKITTYRALHEKRQTLERERERLNNRVSAALPRRFYIQAAMLSQVARFIYSY